MMYRVHVVTPAGRKHMVDEQESPLRDLGIANRHLLYADNESVPPDDDWNLRFIYPTTPKIHVGLQLYNQHNSWNEFEDDDWYLCLCDDDWFCPGLIDVLRTQGGCDVLVVSMDRGDFQPEGSAHPIWPLVADRSNLSYGHAAFEQGIYRGRVMNQLREAAKEMAAKHTPNEDFLFLAASAFLTYYRPDLKIWFNYLEPLRWTNRAPLS